MPKPDAAGAVIPAAHPLGIAGGPHREAGREMPPSEPGCAGDEDTCVIALPR